MDKKWWTLTAVCLGTFMLLLDITIVNVALPDIQHSLNTNYADLQWVVDAYALTLAAMLVTTGSLADLFGRRIVFTTGLVVFTAGSLLCGLAQSSEMLILSRAGQGIGGAAMFSTSLALLASAFQGRERGVAFGIWGSITGIAVAVGPVLGGVLTTGISWKWIFFVNLPVGVLAIAITLWRVEESRQPGAKRPDWTGFVTFTACLVLLIYGLIRSSQHGWTEDGVIACFAGSFLMLVVFLTVESLTSRPMFDLSLFKKPTFDGGAVAAFGLSSSLFALLLYLVLFLQDIRGFSALGTGLRLLILSAGIMVAATIAGRATTKVPIRLLVGPGLVIVGVGLFLMSRLTPSDSWTELIPGFIVAGIGAGIVNPPLASTAVGVVEPARSGMASGINSTFRQVGIATGTAALGSILASEVSSRTSSALAAHGIGPFTAQQFSTAITGGESTQYVQQQIPGTSQPFFHSVANEAFVHSLDRILLIGAVTAVVAGVLALILVRARDFAAGSQGHREQAPAPDSTDAPEVVATREPVTPIPPRRSATNGTNGRKERRQPEPAMAGALRGGADADDAPGQDTSGDGAPTDPPFSAWPRADGAERDGTSANGDSANGDSANGHRAVEQPSLVTDAEAVAAPADTEPALAADPENAEADPPAPAQEPVEAVTAEPAAAPAAATEDEALVPQAAVTEEPAPPVAAAEQPTAGTDLVPIVAEAPPASDGARTTAEAAPTPGDDRPSRELAITLTIRFTRPRSRRRA